MRISPAGANRGKDLRLQSTVFVISIIAPRHIFLAFFAPWRLGVSLGKAVSLAKPGSLRAHVGSKTSLTPSRKGAKNARRSNTASRRFEVEDLSSLTGRTSGLPLELCDKAIWLDHGEMVMGGTINEVLEAYNGRGAIAV